ncbi:MAG: hypothetical protein RLY20_1845, partial [Verrucomicrobiota bacterium]
MSCQREGMNHEHSTRPVFGRSAKRGRWLFFPRPVAWVVLAISLVASTFGFFIAWRHAELEARKRFDEGVGQISAALSERLRVYQDVLHGAVGLYAASVSVERAEMRAYLESVSINQRFPGIDAVGYVACVRPGELNSFLRATRADMAPDFQLREVPGTNDLFIVKYMEPEQRHHARLGYDWALDPERRAVSERAARSDAASVSAVLELTDDASNMHPGFLMVLPVYRHGMPTSTELQRQEAVEGWVFARFVMDQLMRQVLEGKDQGLYFRVFDATGTGSEKLIFDEDAGVVTKRPDEAAWFSTTALTRFCGRTWLLRVASRPSFESSMRHGSSLWFGAGGALISLLLFGIVWSLSHTRERALAIANHMTGALRETNEKLAAQVAERQRSEAALKQSEVLYHSLVENLPLSITRKDPDLRFVFANQRFCNRVGKTREELTGLTDADLFPPEMAARRAQADQQVIETGVTSEMVEERPMPDGTIRFVQAIRTPLYDESRKLVGLLGIFWDVTDKRRAEAELEHERFLLRTLMDNLPDRIYFKDSQSRFLRNSRGHLLRFNLSDPN